MTPTEIAAKLTEAEKRALRGLKKVPHEDIVALIHAERECGSHFFNRDYDLNPLGRDVLAELDKEPRA